MNVIGLEISTSAAKAILFSLEEGVIDEVLIKYGQKGADTLHLDPKRVWAVSIEALKKGCLWDKEKNFRNWSGQRLA